MKSMFLKKVIQLLLKFSDEVLNIDGKTHSSSELNDIRIKSCPHTFTIKRIGFLLFIYLYKKEKRKRRKMKSIQPLPLHY